MLTALDRANLFVVPLDDQREWYRFHHLFADVLRARLLAEQPDLVPLLHERASRWYEQHDLADESVRHALAAGDMDRVVHLMEMEVASVRRDRREATFMGWLKAVPDEFVRRSPVLSVFSAYTHMASGNLDAVEPRLLDAERELARRTNRIGTAVGRHRRAPHAARDHRRLPRVGRPGSRRHPGHEGPGPPSSRPRSPQRPPRPRQRCRVPRPRGLGGGRRDERSGDVHPGRGEPQRGRGVRRRAEQHRGPRGPVPHGRAAAHGAAALPTRPGAGRGARRRLRPRDGRPARRGQRGRGGGRRAGERPPASLHGRGPRRPAVDGRERLPVVRGHGSGRRGRGRARRGDRSPGPGGGAVPARASSRTCGPSER